MAEELIGNNIASELSFEDAIKRGILPEFDYISTVYGTEESLKKLKAQIDESRMSSIKREQAIKFYQDLKAKLEHNIKQLPQILQTYMRNPHGKYIVFCRNIVDMKAKMEEARRLFSKDKYNNCQPNEIIYDKIINYYKIKVKKR